MSSKEKLFKRLQQIPSDFTFNELKTLLEYYGYHQLNNSGSSVKFIKDDVAICFHKPRPSNNVKKYVLKQILTKIKEID